MAAPRKNRSNSRRASDAPAVPSTMLPPESASPDREPSESARMNGNSRVDADEVAAEAFSLYLARGGQDGDDLGDWYAAEEIVRQRHAGPHREHDE